MVADISSYVEGWRQKILREERANEERRQQAVSDAHKIARFLGERVGVEKVVGIASARRSMKIASALALILISWLLDYPKPVTLPSWAKSAY
jgi:hypothetical protein